MPLNRKEPPHKMDSPTSMLHSTAPMDFCDI